MGSAGCLHHLLSTSGGCRVHRCDHGTIHVTLGALTLRLAESQLTDLAAALSAATRVLSVPSERRSRLLS